MRMSKFSNAKSLVSKSKSNSSNSKDGDRERERSAPLLETFDSIKEPKSKSFYTVEEYEEKSEENFKIEKIECLIRDDRKFIIVTLSKIFTLGIVNILFNLFPNAKYNLLYQKTTLKKATHMAIYGADKKFYIVEAFEMDLPKIPSSVIVNHCKTNVHSQKTKIFQFKLNKFIYSPVKKCFLITKFQINSTFEIIGRKFLNGLTDLEVSYQRSIYGNCDLEVETDSVGKLLFGEIKDPFYVFQVFSVVLWMFNNYVKYAIVIILTTIVSLIIAIYEVKANLESIKKMARYNCEVIIFRNVNGEKKAIKCRSTDLVPGDLFELPADDLSMPCDALLVSGSVIMNESMLTGESIPVLKAHIPNSTSFLNYKEDTKYILYAGTKIIQKRNIKDSKVMGIVTNTGFETEKGKLIKSILYPKELKFRFETDSWRYIVFMAVLSLFGFAVSVKYMLANHMDLFQVLNKGLDLITTTVPPALPACLGIGISYALSRLKKSGIKCINRQRVNIAGQVNLVCFDKTGTLTEDHLQIFGFRPIHFHQGRFIFESFHSDCKPIVDESYNFQKTQEFNNSNLINNSRTFEIGKNHENKIKMLRVFFVECLATCHSITRVNGKIIGDPIDIGMFQSTGWLLQENLEGKENYDPIVHTLVRHHQEKDTKDLIEDYHSKQNVSFANLEENTNQQQDLMEYEDRIIRSQYELGIVRHFEFSSKLQRMSVIVKNVNEDHFKVFCKGSPEKLRELCREDTIPSSFHAVLSNYTNKGFRVLGMACKLIKMDYLQSQRMPRESAENNMIFLGFIIVQNKLKHFTTPSIEILHNAGLKLIMATGDNILTAVSVSKDCKMVPQDSPVYQCNISTEVNNPNEYRLECNLLYGKEEREESDVENEEDESDTESNASFNSKTSKVSKVSKAASSKHSKKSKASVDLTTSKYQTKFNKLQTRISKLTKNLNVEVFEEDGTEEEDEKEVENYDDEYNNIIIKKKDKKNRAKVEYEIDSLRIDLGNLNYSHDMDFIEEDYVIAVTGSTFEILYKLQNKFTSTKDKKYRPYYDIFRFLLSKSKIYARMSPDQKTLLIESLREEKFTVAMCGDGANDIGALRAADVGISLSVEEASIAAHFTSTVPEITCLIKLLREGKASLITSIQCFKYMMLYSMIQFFSATMLLILGTYLSEYEFLAVDLCLIFPLAILIARTGAFKELTPHQPTGALISMPIISSVILQSLIQLIAQYTTYVLLISQSWYVPYTKDYRISTEVLVDASLENTCIFFVSFIQYITTAIAFSISKPFKKEINSNYFLCGFLACSVVFSYYLILSNDPILIYIFNLKEIKYLNFKLILIFITIINFILSYSIEKIVVPNITQKWKKFKKEKLIKEIQSRKRSYHLNELDKIKLNIK